MHPQFLVPETTVREAGTGPELDLGSDRADSMILTLGITRIIEQESLDVSIWGSSDGKDWGTKPLVSFPQKFYCGTYQILLDISDHADVRYLRTKWQVNRWGKGDNKPLFTVYVFLQSMDRRLVAAGA